MDKHSSPPLFSPWDLLLLLGALAVGLLAAIHWPQLPSQIPTHFTPGGHPNGWTPKKVALWFLFGLPLGSWLLLLVAGRLTRFNNPQQRALQASAMAPLRGLLGLGMFALTSLMVLIPVYGLGAFAPALIVFLGLTLLGVVLSTRKALGLVPLEVRQAYRWGLVYYNPKDPRVWVEKLLGIGWTLNFARPMAWVWLLILLLPVALLLVLPRLR